MTNYSTLYSAKTKSGKYPEYLRLCCKTSRIRLHMHIPRIISPVRGSFITAAVRPTPELPRPVVY